MVIGGSVGVRKLLLSEIKALREVAEKRNDAQALVLLDFLETDTGDFLLPLAMTIHMSADFASADGLSETQWLQRLLSRYGSDPETLEILWSVLVDLRKNGAWPWVQTLTA